MCSDPPAIPTQNYRSDRFTSSSFGLHCLTAAIASMRLLVDPTHTGLHFTPNAVKLL